MCSVEYPDLLHPNGSKDINPTQPLVVPQGRGWQRCCWVRRCRAVQVAASETPREICPEEFGARGWVEVRNIISTEIDR